MQIQYNKYWPKQSFYIVGSKKPKYRLDYNFKFESLGTDIDDNTDWNLALNNYFINLNLNYFFLAFEDHFLINLVNTDFIKKAESVMLKDDTVGKVRLLPKYKFCNDLKSYNSDFFYVEEPTSTYLTTSLRPSIWRKDFFMNLLNNNNSTTPHKFETSNLNINFGMKILIPKTEIPVFPDLDAMRCGKPNNQASKAGKIIYDYYQIELKSEDLKVFRKIKDTWENGI